MMTLPADERTGAAVLDRGGLDRYAYPPNELGYCSPGNSRELLEYAGTGVTDRGLSALARQFHRARLWLVNHALGRPAAPLALEPTRNQAVSIG